MTELRQRDPRVECPAFLAFLRRRPCCACGAPPPSQAAHLRTTDATHPEKRSVGLGEKPSDRWCNPLCASCHLDAPDAQHKIGERMFWARVGVDPFDNASKLWGQFVRRRGRSPEQRERVVERASRIKRKGRSSPKIKAKRNGLSRPIRAKFPAHVRQWPKRSFPKRQTR